MYVFILQKKKFFCCYSYNSVKVLESPGILLKVLEKSWNFDAKSCGKTKKKSPGKFWNLNQFFGGNHELFCSTGENFGIARETFLGLCGGTMLC